jgi:hypothetical protein
VPPLRRIGTKREFIRPFVRNWTDGGGVSALVALGAWLLAAAAQEVEPGLVETQEAAARMAGGTAAQDAARVSRARAAHWAPQLRGLATSRDEEKSRNGEYRLTPLHEQDLFAGRAWTVALTWDLSQVIFAREEAQLALAHAQLARARKEAAERGAQLWLERRQARAHWLAARTGESCFGLLRVTAALFAITGTLFREALAREEAACVGERG